MKNSRYFLLKKIFVIAALMTTASSFAANDFWKPLNAGGTWDTTTANWSTTGNNTGTSAVWLTGSTAVFGTTIDGGVDGYPITIGSAGLTAAGLSFTSSGYQIKAGSAQTMILSTVAPIAIAAGKTAYLGNNATLDLQWGSAGSSFINLNGDSSILTIESGATLAHTQDSGIRGLIFTAPTASTLGTVNVLGTVSWTSVGTGQIVIGQGASAASTTGATTVNVNGGGSIATSSTGAASSLGSITLNNNGNTANLNVGNGTGTGTITISSTATTAGLNINRVSPGGSGTVTLGVGGTITTPRVFTGAIGAPAGSGTFNFNGGKLVANVANSSDFFANLTAANIQSGGGIIDNGGFAITIGQALLGVGGMTFTGAGTTTLSGANTYTGTTAINGGTVNAGIAETVNTSGPFGKSVAANPGSITFGGGTLQYSAANQNDYSGRFSTAASQPVSIDVGAQNVTFASALSSSGGTLTKLGTGTLTLSVANTFSGATTVSAGTLSVANTSYLGGVAADNAMVFNGGTLQITGTSMNNFGSHTPTFTATKLVGLDINNIANNFTVSQALNQTTGGLTKSGAGTLTLSGANNYTGATIVNQGVLTVSGSGGISASATIKVGGTAAQAGAMYQNTSGTVVNTSTAGGAFDIGGVAGAWGYYNLASGILNIGGEIDPGGAGGGAGTFGQFDMSGGTVNLPNSTSSYFLPNRAQSGTSPIGESSVVNISGGTVQIIGGATPADGNFNGLSINWAGGSQTNATTISGTGQFLTPSLRVKLNQGTSFDGQGVNGSANVTALNLNGGTLQTLGFLNGAVAVNGNVKINFNGGTLKAGNAANANFLSGLGGTYIYSGGATIDDNGQAITIGQALLAPTGNGVATIPVNTGGAGYIVPPSVIITGGGGSGATAFATISGGAVTAVTVTSRGNGYTSIPTVAFGAVGATSAATVGTVTTSANTSGGLTKQGVGTLTLSGANTYTGNTTVGSGILALSGSGSLASSGIVVSSSATLDLTATTATFALASGQSLFNSGTVTGAVTTVTGAKIYAGTDGGYATNTYKTNLTFVSGALAYLDLGTTVAGVNDRINVNGALALNNTVFHIKAPSTLVNLDATTDYVLISAGSISGTPAVTPVFDVAPVNAAHYTIAISGNTVVLHYNVNIPPTGGGTASPASLARNQSTFISVAATNNGSGTITSVTLDTSSIGGSSSFPLVSDGAGNWTNMVMVSAGTTAGSKTLFATITDTVSLTGTTPIALTVTTANEVWNGGGGGDSWSTNANWTSGVAPGLTGDSLTFAGTTRLTPSMDTNYSVTGLIFDGTAGAFNIGTPNGSALTLTGVGVTNNSVNAQTLNVPVVLGAAQIFNAAAGNLTLSQNVTNGGFAVTVAGASTTVVNGAISGSGGLTKNDTGTLTLNGANNYTGNATVSGGTLNMSGSLNAGGGGITLNPANAAAATLNYSGTGAFIRTGQLIAGSVAGGTGTVNVNDAVSVSFGSGISYVGYLSGIGVLNLTNGTFNNAGELQVGGSDTSGTGINGTGTFTMSGGTANLGALTVARGNNNQNTVSGSVNANGGTLTSTNDVILGFAGNGNLGKLALNGGTVNVGPAATKWLILGQFDTSMGELDITNGALNLMNNTSIKFSPGATATASTNVVNQIGGTVTFYSDAGTTIGGSGDLNLQQSGGSAANNTYNLNGGTLIVPSIGSALTTGTRAFNFNGGTLKPTANNATFMNLGTGNARANVRDGGAIIDSNGKDITIVQALLHSNIGGDAATDGGLTKQGLGTLTLSGANSYGVTTVTAGTLQLSGSGTFGTGTVTNNGALLLSGTRTVANVIAGTGSLTNDATGTLTLTASNSFSGATTINGGLVIATNNALGNSPTVTVVSTTGGPLGGTRVTLNAGVVTPSGTALSLPSTGTTVRSTLLAAGNSTWGGGLTLNADNNTGNTIALAASGGTLTVNGNITGVNFPGSLQLRGNGGGSGFSGVINGIVNIGSGTMQVNDGVTWTINSTGNTWAISQIANGTMVVGQNNALPTTTTVRFGLAGNGTLDLGGFNQQVAGLIIEGGTDVITNSSTLADSTLTFATNGGASSFGGVIKNGATRNVALNVTAGALTLAGVNTFTGNTTVSGGTLALTNSGSIANSANITVNGGALYDVSAVTNIYNLGVAQTLAGNGSVKGVVTNLGTIAPGIGGTGTLTFSNSPVMKGTVLAEINTASSPTADNVTVNGALNYGGTLTVNNIGAALTGGEVFTLFSAPSYSGAFSTTSLPVLAGGLNWWLGNLVTNGTISVNRAPIATTMTVTRTAGLAVMISLANVATNWSDADGGTVTLTGITLVTTNGVNLATNGAYILYTNSPNVNDQFSYGISDGQGGTNIGYVNIVVNSSVTGTNSIATITGGNPTMLTAFGIPGYSYITERSTNLNDWVGVSTNTAATNGVISVTDSFSDLGGIPPGSAYYRLKWQP